MRSIQDESNLNEKKILLRLDLNVPLDKGKITDTTRIDKVIPTINFLLKSKIFISLCVFCLALSTQFMIGEYNLNLLFLLFFGTFLSYNYQRIIFHIKLKNKHSISWFFGNKKLIFLIAMAGILFLCCFFQLKTITKLMVILLSSVSLFYPMLRKIPFLKILLISFSRKRNK